MISDLNRQMQLAIEQVAYEIKVSRGDFLRELKNKKKRRMALRYSNYFWFITPHKARDAARALLRHYLGPFQIERGWKP